MTQVKGQKTQVGDSIRVKDGTKDPDFGIDIGGWQGQASEIKKDLIGILWDSVTLSKFPDKLIAKCEQEGMDWKRIYLEISAVEISEPRDKGDELSKKIKEIEFNHRWDHLEDSGERISKILKHIDPDDDSKAFMAWEKHLSQLLSFPFEAEISEYQDRGPLRQGDKIRIHSLNGHKDRFGILVMVKYGRKKYHFPLCDVSVLDEASSNYQPVEDYKEWFSNR
jgi:hypothetical protein